MRQLGFILLVVLSQPVAASALSQEQLDDCKGYSKVAGKIMESRQGGERMSDMMDMVSKMKGFEALAQSMVSDAYGKPRYGSEGQKERAVVEFENEVYAACVSKHREAERK